MPLPPDSPAAPAGVSAPARLSLEHLCRLAVESSASAIMITDACAPGYPIVFVNPAFTRITGYSLEQVYGRNGRFLLGDELRHDSVESLRNLLRRGAAGCVLLRSVRCDGVRFWNEVHVAPAHDEQGQLSHYVSIMNDVSERIAQTAQLQYLSEHDALTGLANRHSLLLHCDRALAHVHAGKGRQLALLLIDVDRFSVVNQALGSEGGDLLLQQLGERLRQILRLDDCLARLGDDEFAILLTDLQQGSDALRVAQKVIRQVANAFRIAGQEIFLHLSIGLAIYPADGKDARTLLRNAQLAMRGVKQSGGNGLRSYSGEVDDEAARLLSFERDLRHALARGEMRLHYQPRVDLPSGRVAGVEALIRWQHPREGLLAPGQFIPLAEGLGIIDALGEWVLQEACRQLQVWRQAGLPTLQMAVNVSAQQLRDSAFPQRVAAILQAHGLEPGWLELEITESAFIHDMQRAAGVLCELQALGIKLALDDFGTGYASLSYLHQLPFHALKIDRAFVTDIQHDANRAALTQAIIAMARSLRMRCIAEGVESAREHQYLRVHLCDEAQGYLYARPLPAEQLFAACTVIEQRYAGLSGPLQQRKATVLLLDDEPAVLNAVRRVLHRAGYRVLSSTLPSQALDILAVERVQVLICDQHLPELRGIEFLKQVRALYPQTVRILLSGHADAEVLREAVNQGEVFRLVFKPWVDDELCRHVQAACERYDAPGESSQPTNWTAEI